MIGLDICAAVAYFPGDWRKVLYWCAAGILTYTVTY